jgi:hypothetical protein
MRVAEEIPDAEFEQTIEGVCAIDVAKASGTVCTRVPQQSTPGRRVSKVWDVKATTNAIIELGEYLVGLGIEKVTVESTSDYWRIWFYLLEACGLDVQLVNAREVKNVPGRPKQTSSIRCGWPSSPRRGCYVPRSCRPLKFVCCATTRGCGSI